MTYYYNIFDVQIFWSSDRKWVISIRSNLWNPNSSFKINLNDDWGTSTSGGIFHTKFSLFSRKQKNILSIRWAVIVSIKWASLQIAFIPLLICLIFFAKIFNMHREKALPPSTSIGNRWLSSAVHPKILPNLRNFPCFRRHFYNSIYQGY